MTTVTVADDNAVEYQFDLTGLQSITVTSFNASQVVLAIAGGGRVVLDGAFGGFDGSNMPTTGTLTAITVGASGQPPALSITSFSMTIPAFRSFVNANDGAGFSAALLAGNDTFTGSNTDGDTFDLGQGDDIADGRGGADTADYSRAASAVTVRLLTVSAQNTIGAGSDTLSHIENLKGSAFNDTLTGDGGTNVLEGGAGDDVLDGLGGFDIASYASATSRVVINLSQTGARNTQGAGTDTLVNIEGVIGSNFNDNLTGRVSGGTLFGGDGDDQLNGFGGNDLFYGGAGRDGFTVTQGGGNATLDGGDGNDSLILNANIGGTVDLSQAGQQSVFAGFGKFTVVSIEDVGGGNGDDVLTGSSLANTLSGGGGSDVLSGMGGNDTLQGGGGDDLIYSDDGDDILKGGAGVDTVTYANAAAAVTVDLTSGQASGGAGNDSLLEFEVLIGSAFNDVLVGDYTATTIEGGAGDDVMRASAYDSMVTYVSATAGVTVSLEYSGIAQDTGGAGIDTLSNFVNLTGSAFDDVLAGYSGGANILDGGAGSDTVSYATAIAGVVVSLARTTAQDTGGGGVDTLLNVESLTGSNFGDTLTMGAAAGTYLGLTGNDLFIANGGSVAARTVNGGAGLDTLSFALVSQGIDINLSTTTAQSAALGLTALNVENAIGSAFADTLTGSAVANALSGGLGSDVLYGVAGDDILRDGGETSNRDFLYGGSGNDTYYVTSAYSAPTEDLVFEGGTNPDLMAGVGDVDIIHSGGDFFWDYYSVGETLYIDATAGSPLLVAGKDVLNKTIYGGAGNDRVVTYGHNGVVDLGAGTDAVDFGSYGLDSSYDGQNKLVMRPGTGTDYIYNFHSGVDKVDLTAFHFGITGAQVLAQAVNVDNTGTANDYSYFYLTNAGGANNFVVFIGLLGSQLQAGDFIT